MNWKNHKSFLLAGLVVVLGLNACLLMNLPPLQQAASSIMTLHSTRHRSVPVPTLEYNELLAPENPTDLVVSNLQAAAIQQRQELANVYAKMIEFDLRANGQESEARTFDESLASLRTNLSETLKRVDGLQRAVIKLSLGMQDLQSAAKPAPSSRPN